MKVVLLLLCCLLSFSAIAQRRHPIDIAFNKCTAAYQNAPGFDGEPGPGRHCDAEAVKAWNAELARLLAKVPSQRAAQIVWASQRDKRIAKMKVDYSSPGVGLTMAGTDEIRWYQIEVTRKRVLELAKLAKEPVFIIPKE